MSENLIPIKTYLGKYYGELLYGASQAKYKDTGLDSFFEQRFYMQNNKVQMIVEPNVPGLVISVSGNEIHVSQTLFKHPSFVITNSMEVSQDTNPKSLYNPDTFSTVAYLICQNHTSFKIVGPIDEPIYVKYSSDYETFYNSVLIFNILEGIDVEIVEEVESFSALNSVTNYILGQGAKLDLKTFYKNHLSAISFCYRNVIAQVGAKYNHTLCGRGSSNVIDENKIYASSKSETEMLGIINSEGMNFHSILYVESALPDYKIDVNYRDILEDKCNVSFFPIIIGEAPPKEDADIVISNITVENLNIDTIDTDISNFVYDIVDRLTLDRMTGTERFYSNKSDFIKIL